MTKADYINLCGQHWDAIKSLEESTTFYDHEKNFVGIWSDLGRSLLERSIGEVSSNHRKKSQYKRYMAKCQ